MNSQTTFSSTTVLCVQQILSTSTPRTGAGASAAAGDLRQLASLDRLAIKPIGWPREERKKGKVTTETAAVGECDERIWHVGGADRTVE